MATDGEILNDITSSGLNQAWDKPSENANRVGEPVITPNYGSVEFIWHELGVDIVLGLSDQSGRLCWKFQSLMQLCPSLYFYHRE